MQTPYPMRRLPLAGTKNTRDLGGYPCDGGATRWGVFLRSDNPAALTAADLEALRAFGVTDTIDLRRAEECARSPSLLCGAPGVAAHQLPLVHTLSDGAFEGDVPGSMSGMYIDLLDNRRTQVAQVMEALAEARGTALFHCAVGKDRTGVVAMLLLKLAGVANMDVVADYAVTDIYMREIFDAQVMAFQNFDIPDYILRSIPASMERVLAHLEENYGNTGDYLRGCGIPAARLERLREKFIQPL